MKRSNPFFDEDLLREANLRVKSVQQAAQPVEEDNWKVDMLECTLLHIGKICSSSTHT